MAVRSLIPIQVFSWIPPDMDSEYSIKVYDKTSGSYSYDITDIILEGEYTDGVTETIGNFTFTIDNSDETYTNTFKVGDTVLVYMDYATTATTLRFEGIIEKISKTENDIKLSGRSYASYFMGTTITYAVDGVYTHDILNDIVFEQGYFGTTMYGNDIDTTESTDTITGVNWSQKPFWECVIELCNTSGYDCYISGSGLWYIGAGIHYFPSGSVQNTTEAVVHESNLIETGDFTPDLSVVKNRIIVYGAQIKDQQIIWTTEDSDSINLYGVKEEIINDNNIITISQAQARADYELSIKKDLPIIGEVTSELLATIKPGEQVRISDPMNGIEPGYYSIQKYTHNFGDETTTLTIQKEVNTIAKVLKKRITFESSSSEMDNPNEMRYSIIYDFNEDTGTHTNTVINTTTGVLKTNGSSFGTWISDPVNTYNGESITGIEVRIDGSNLVGSNNVTNVNVYLSTDGGLTFIQSLLPAGTNVSITSGTNIITKVTFSSADTELKSIGVYYKT